MNSGSPTQELIDWNLLEWPPRKWSLLSALAWVQDMATGQTPVHVQAKTKGDPQTPLASLVGEDVRGAQRDQLRIMAEGMQRDLDLQFAREPWGIHYRREYHPGWLPVKVAPYSDSDRNVARSAQMPDRLAILCPAEFLSQMLSTAESMLVLCPGRISHQGSRRVLSVESGPCLTIAHGFMRIVAHTMLDDLPDVPLQVPAGEPPAQVTQELASACDFTHAYLGEGLHWWVPMLPDPRGASALRY